MKWGTVAIGHIPARTVSRAPVVVRVTLHRSPLVAGLVPNLSPSAGRSSSRSWPSPQPRTVHCPERGNYSSYSSHYLPFPPSILICIPRSCEIYLSKGSLQSISSAFSKGFNGSWLPNKLNTKRPVWDFRAFVFCIPSTFLVLTLITSLISWVPAKPSLLTIKYAPYSYFVPFSIKKRAREKAWNFPQLISLPLRTTIFLWTLGAFIISLMELPSL